MTEQVSETPKEQTPTTAVSTGVTAVEAAAATVVEAPPSSSTGDSLAPAAAVPSAEPAEPAPAGEVKLIPHTETPTLLQEAGAKVEEKPTEAKPDEVKQPEPPKPGEPITYTDFTLPEGLKFDDKRLSELKSTLSKYGLSQEAGQELVSLHANVMKAYDAQTLANQHKAFLDMRKGWVNDAMADPEIGGAGFQTSLKAIARMRDLLVPEADRAKFDEFLSITGAGDHPAFLRLLHNAARYFDEPAAPAAVGTPVPQRGKGNGRAQVLYDHPTSQHPR